MWRARGDAVAQTNRGVYVRTRHVERKRDGEGWGVGGWVQRGIMAVNHILHKYIKAPS